MSNGKVIESVLFKIVDILEANHIDYWLTDGTLLGIIRENRILLWDLDVDIGVWKSEVSVSNLISVLEKNGFRYLERLSNMDSHHFLLGEVLLDINLYSRDQKNVSIKWASNPTKLVDRIFVKSINAIYESHKGTCIVDTNRSTSVVVFKWLMGAFGRLLPQNILEKMYANARSKYLYIGCSYPSQLLKMKKISFRKRVLTVPSNCNEYLRLTYGEDWMKPNQNYKWEVDTKNLKSIKNEV
tara:strand:- start:2214 stop:2936 length:723 start_codon:yes stop_codon:yes gene_type:complete